MWQDKLVCRETFWDIIHNPDMGYSDTIGKYIEVSSYFFRVLWKLPPKCVHSTLFVSVRIQFCFDKGARQVYLIIKYFIEVKSTTWDYWRFISLIFFLSLHPGDLFPFTRKPLFVIVDSTNSTAYKVRHLGTRILKKDSFWGKRCQIKYK